MKRKIKFRVWDKTNREMGFVTTLEWMHEEHLRGCMFDTESDFNRALNADGFELMQYTGLLDKNGREIYEGDILQTDHPDVPNVHVFWYEQEARWNLQYAGKIGPGSDCELNDSISYTSGVIGNIHEHGHLIK